MKLSARQLLQTRIGESDTPVAIDVKSSHTHQNFGLYATPEDEKARRTIQMIGDLERDDRSQSPRIQATRVSERSIQVFS